MLKKLSLLAVLLQFSLLASGAATPDPVTAVKTATTTLLEKLREVRPLYDEDRQRFFSEVKSSMAPFIDFEGFSRGVMAKYYRRATDEQQERFEIAFQDELIRTYASALVEFDNQKVEVLPLDEPPEQGRATVKLEVYGNDGTVYPVTYTLALVDDRWKLRNVIVEGINLGLQFRSQFSNYMQKFNNDIDKVIANWNVQV